jgi:opacity protein-like surface antigen
MRYIYLTFFLLVTNLHFTLRAQSNLQESQPTIVGLSFDYALLLRHSQNLQELGKSYPVGIGVEWSKMLLTEEAWEFCNCLPRIGAQVSFWDWDNSEVLGNGVLAMGFVEPYFRTHKRLNILFRAGLGGAYLSNPYDEATNPLNLSYSTDLSFAIMVGAGFNYRLTDQWNIGLLANYSHTSNGGVSSPNKGLNFPSLSFHVQKSLTPIRFPEFQKVENRQAPENKSRFSLAHFSSWNDISIDERVNYYVFGLEAKYSRWIGNRSAISLGTEFISDYSRREELKIEELDNNFVQASALIGHEFWLGRVTFSQQIGVYYYNDYRVTDDVYQRYGLTYNFNKNLFAGINLKAHRHVADFFDFRIGYTF